MPKTSKALTRLAPQTLNAIEAMGAHLAVARMRRKQSLATWARRIGVSVPTLMRMEAGDVSVSMGLYATALWLIGRDGELARIASPEHDKGALELDVREAVQLGKDRALAAQRTRVTRERAAAKGRLAELTDPAKDPAVNSSRDAATARDQP